MSSNYCQIEFLASQVCVQFKPTPTKPEVIYTK